METFNSIEDISNWQNDNVPEKQKLLSFRNSTSSRFWVYEKKGIYTVATKNINLDGWHRKMSLNVALALVKSDQFIKNNDKFNFNIVQDSIEITHKTQSYDSYPKLIKIAQEFQKIVQCKFEYKQKQNGAKIEMKIILYPDKQVCGYFLELRNSDPLNEIENFAKNLGILFYKGEDEVKFHQLNLKLKLEWADFLLPTHEGVLFGFRELTSMDRNVFDPKKVYYGRISKSPILIDKKIEHNEINLIYQVSAFEQGRLNDWKKVVVEDFTFWNKYYEEETKNFINKQKIKTPYKSKYYNDDLDMDQQGSEFWNDL